MSLCVQKHACFCSVVEHRREVYSNDRERNKTFKYAVGDVCACVGNGCPFICMYTHYSLPGLDLSAVQERGLAPVD